MHPVHCHPYVGGRRGVPTGRLGDPPRVLHYPRAARPRQALLRAPGHSEMGTQLPARRGKEAPSGDGETLVLISVDLTRRKRRLKLDGIDREDCYHPWLQQLRDFLSFYLLLEMVDLLTVFSVYLSILIY